MFGLNELNLLSGRPPAGAAVLSLPGWKCTESQVSSKYIWVSGYNFTRADMLDEAPPLRGCGLLPSIACYTTVSDAWWEANLTGETSEMTRRGKVNTAFGLS